MADQLLNTRFYVISSPKVEYWIKEVRNSGDKIIIAWLSISGKEQSMGYSLSSVKLYFSSGDWIKVTKDSTTDTTTPDTSKCICPKEIWMNGCKCGSITPYKAKF